MDNGESSYRRYLSGDESAFHDIAKVLLCDLLDLGVGDIFKLARNERLTHLDRFLGRVVKQEFL